MDEAHLYTSDEDKGGWGSKNSFLRNFLGTHSIAGVSTYCK